MARLTFAHVSARYGSVTALDDLDLTVADGELLCLLGPSGCGKSTTLRLVAGFLQPASGRILFDDDDVADTPPNRRQIGMVFQDYALFPHMSVADNIGFGLVERGAAPAAIRARVAALLELVHLPGFERRYPAELSGGQRQRVALARAVAHPPRVLLMDEPLGALDLKLREAMQTEIRRIQRALAITTIYVTHDQGEAMSLADRIAVMDRGRIVQAASAQVLYNRPRTRFVADFVGKTNFIAVGDAAGACGGARATALGVPIRIAAAPPQLVGAMTLAVRPEQLKLAPANAAIVDRNALPGRIAAVRFAGNVTHCDVVLADGTAVLVETASDDPLARAGDDVQVAWGYDRCALLEDDA
jgi:ABC-type Fe3+/spermidine/putrescine transport system ATPase subunit